MSRIIWAGILVFATGGTLAIFDALYLFPHHPILGWPIVLFVEVPFGAGVLIVAVLFLVIPELLGLPGSTGRRGAREVR